MTLRTHKNPNAKRFGEIIHRLRNERGMSVRELAYKAVYDYRHMLVLERGDNIPTLQTIFDLAEALGVKGSAILAEIEATGAAITRR